jgi:hypothetical protein
MNYKFFNKVTYFITVLFLAFASLSYSQINQIGKLAAGGIEDGEALFKEYLRPYTNALGANLSGGWYNTAKPHQTLGFDLSFSFNTAIIPKDATEFNLQTLKEDENLTYTLSDPDDILAPTAAGEKQQGPEIGYDITDNGNNDIVYNTPPGTGLRYIPTPMIKAGVGIVKNTEIMGRYMPTISSNNWGSIGLWGIGIKHGLKQHLPFMEKVPVLNLSIMAAYTKLNAAFNMDIQPEDVGYNNYSGDEYENQELTLDIGSFTANLLVSADLPVVAFYGGIGFSTVKSDLALKGDYPMIGTSTTNPTTVTDPFSIQIKNQDGGTVKPRLNAGMCFTFGVVTLSMDYTKANYSVATAGLGISIR